MLLALAGVLLAGGVGVGSFASHGPGLALAPLRTVSTPLAPSVHPAATTYGDLEVTAANSPYVISPATTGSILYEQGGNITVLAGGTLIVQNTTLEFVQFIGGTGDVFQRTTHLYHFTDQGTVQFWNSTLTTDTQVLNTFPKLTLNVSAAGQFTAKDSTFAFPGWVSVYGAGSLLAATGTLIEDNPLVANVSENQTVLHDEEYAPTFSVGGGAHAFLGASAVRPLYADNVSAYGVPGMNPISSTGGHVIDGATTATWNQWTTVNNTENLTRDLLSPTIGSGYLEFDYSSTTNTSSATNSLTYGASFGLPAIDWSTTSTEVQVPLPAGVVSTINSGGLAAFLEATGAWGNAATLSVSVGTDAPASAVDIFATSFHFYTDLNYNLSVSGSGTEFTAVDTTLGLNWNLTPVSQYSVNTYPPTSWGSNKLLVSDGAAAYLANVTIPVNHTNDYWTDSAVQTSSGGTANFYRWAAIPVGAAAGVAISGAQVAAFYAYDTNQASNATANGLNNLALTDPLLSSYVTAAYPQGAGVTNAGGVAQLLLASTQLTYATLPDGQYLGDYHVAVTLAGGGTGSTEWGYTSVAPYPDWMNPATSDVSGAFSFPTYAPELSVSGVTVEVNSLAVPTVNVGQTINVSATVKNTGSGPVGKLAVSLVYVQKSPLPAVVIGGPANFSALAAGNSLPVNFTWKSNESVLGDQGTFNGTFAIVATWNGGIGPNAGSTTYPFTVRFAPSLISLTITAPDEPLKVGTAYVVLGTVHFNGTGQATINITAVAPDGNRYLIGTIDTQQGSFLIDVAVTSDMPSGTYEINASANYNHYTTYVLALNAFTIGTTTTSSPSFLSQTLLGLPLYLWIIIAAVIVAALLIFFFVVRRQARGKLVECGECGQLIPEDATVCPKCGAEFENDLVRCSRCGSTIPANSQVCPECAATLIGKPEEGARDPERQGYNDFVERYRAEARKELGDNYGEGAFWDWWKRQPTYLAFSQWKLQQQQGSRTGMGAPPTSTPGRGGGGGAGGADAAAPGTAKRPPAAVPPKSGGAPPPGRAAASPTAAPSPPATPTAPAAPATAAAPAAGGAPGGGLKPCSNCGKEIPPDYLVCPFCGAVTQ